MYHPTTRVLTVLELLQSHQQISGPALAARLEVDVRTVRRYVAMLQDLGIPIDAEVGRHGGYTLRAGFKLPPLMFTEDEALALTLGLLMARRAGLDAAAPAAEGALAKVDRVLPQHLRERVQSLQHTVVLDPHEGPPADAAISGALLMTLSLAAQQRRRVHLRYRSRHADESERLIDPYGLVHQGGAWYTVGYCHLRDGLRIFRLDRVLAAELCAQQFDRPDPFDCLEYILGSFASIPDTWAVEVLLQTTAEQARRWVPPALAMFEQTPQGLLLRSWIDDLDHMARFLAGLRCPMTIRRPEELRQALQALAHDLLQTAQRREEVSH